MTGFVKQTFKDITGQSAAEDIKAAGETSAESQREALEYYKEINAAPQAFREGALALIGQNYGIALDPETGKYTLTDPTAATQEETLALAESSPYYQARLKAIESTRESGEETLARRAAMGAGIGAGATTGELIGFNQNLGLMKEQALVDAYGQQRQEQQQRLSGLGSLAGTQTYADQIGQTISGIGQTQAQAQIAAAQAQQQAMGGLLGGASTLGAAYMMMPAASDERLKDDIIKIADTPHPDISYYEWMWKPEAEKEGKDEGYIAQEVEKVWPDLVVTGDNGYKAIYKEEVQNRLKELANG